MRNGGKSWVEQATGLAFSHRCRLTGTSATMLRHLQPSQTCANQVLHFTISPPHPLSIRYSPFGSLGAERQFLSLPLSPSPPPLSLSLVLPRYPLCTHYLLSLSHQSRCLGVQWQQRSSGWVSRSQNVDG